MYGQSGQRVTKNISDTSYWMEKAETVDREQQRLNLINSELEAVVFWWAAHFYSEVKGAEIRGETFSLC